jgi:glycosyltransferase involved in cell wall biosynthesis
MNGWGKALTRASLKYWLEKARVLEVGSLNVQENEAGSVRVDVQRFAGEYIGIDIRAGYDVDYVIPAEQIIEAFGKNSFDVVLSTEMLEHAHNWYVSVYNMIMALKPGGILALTTRSPGFGRHEYPSDYWRFTQQDFKEIFTPIGDILQLEDDDSGFPGVGIIVRKNSTEMTTSESDTWLNLLKNKRIVSLDYGTCTYDEMAEREHHMPTISLVMIVKNEAKILERSIESVKAIVDEFVIVDTGSTDGTQDIIKKYGTLYEYPFTNYVDTKNHALDLVKTDYVLFMDADEYFVSGLEFLKEHAKSRTECVYANIVEGSDTVTAQVYLRARMWVNKQIYRFDGPGVHEVLVNVDGGIIDKRINVRHDHSHRTPESYTAKSRDYIALMVAHLEKHPNDPRALFYLGRTHREMGNYLTAVTYLKRYLDRNTNFKDERWQAAIDTALCWKAQGEYDKALDACTLGESIDPRRAEIQVLRGQIYFDLQEFDEGIKYFKIASTMPVPQDVILFLNPLAHLEIPLDYLVLSYDKTKQYRKGQEVAQRLVNMSPTVDQRLSNNLGWLNGQVFRTIFFTLGLTPENVYGGMIDKQGVGGVETTYLELPEEMAKRGHTCFVFCKCEKEHSYNGVNFIPFEKINEYADWKPDVIITSRWFDPFYMFKDAKKIIWMQDSHFADPNHPDTWQIVDAVFCSSPWHRQYTAERLGQGLLAKKIHVVPLAIRRELFQYAVERDPLKMIYSSNPDRGLYILADMWDEISREVKGIRLTVTYGWEGLRTWSSDPSWLKKIEDDKKRMDNWVKAAGNVSITGRLKKADLAKEMLSSTLCLYPNNFWETFCLTALETQAAGVPMITTNIGALSTTLCKTSNVFAGYDPFSDEYKQEFIKDTLELMNNPKMIETYSKECMAYFEQQPTWAQVAEQWENIIYNL